MVCFDFGSLAICKAKSVPMVVAIVAARSARMSELKNDYTTKIGIYKKNKIKIK